MKICRRVKVSSYKYRVIHKSLRDFRTRLRNNQDRHGRTEHINRYRISTSFFFVLGALAYFQVPPLGGSRDEKWRAQWIRKRSVSWNLPKLSQLWLCNGGFGSCTTQNHLQTKQFVNGTWIPVKWLPVRCETNRQPLCWNSCTIHELFCLYRWFCVVHDPKPPLHSHNWISFGKFQGTEHFLSHCERHFSSRLPSSGGTWKYAEAPSTKKKLGEILYVLICSFLPSPSWLLRSRVRKSRRDLWITP